MTVMAEPGALQDTRGPGRGFDRPLRRRSRLRPLRILGGLFALCVLLLLGAGVWIAWGLPEISLDRPTNGQPMIILEATDGSPITKSGGTSGLPVVREELPAHLVGAVLAIEDRRFFDHSGVDVFGILRAAYRNFHAGGIVEGGSTITQQLAKVLFLNREQTLRRKLQEAAIATLLELRLSKDEILTKYLDSIYFGAGATGVSAAARVYFDKPVAELTLAESAMLAGLIQAPSKLNPLTNLKAARARATVVLQAMVTSGFVTREEAIAAALNSAVPVRGSSIAQTGSWFGDWVYTEAVSRMGPLAGEARIRTTLRPELQALAETVVENALRRSGSASRVGQAALVAMTMDGAVVAMVGGRSYRASQFNRATSAQRQPGSAFKTFVYLAALQSGWSIDDTVLDAPIEIGGWRPQNYSGGFQGKVTLEQAFSRSLNAPTVRLAQDVGIDKVIAVARDLGIDAELRPNLTLSLGTSEVTLLDLTGAYASIASGRVPLQPWGIAGVSSDAGAEPSIFAESPKQGRALAKREEMMTLLAQVVREGTGKRAALEGFAAGKTGTSQSHRDGWFVGFTEQLVVGVWVGNDDNAPMKGVTGGGLPAEIWRDFMAKAMGRVPIGEVLEGEPVPEELPVAEEVPVAEAESDEAAAEDEVELVEDGSGAFAEEEQGSADPAIEEEAVAESRSPPAEPEAAPAITQAPVAPPSRRTAARAEPERRAVEERAAPAPRNGKARSKPQPETVEPAVPPQRRVVARRSAEPEPRVEQQRARPQRQVARRSAEPEPRVARQPAQPQRQVARRSAEPAPRIVDRQVEPNSLLARRRALAEQYAARRKVQAQASARAEGPSILLGGRRARD